MDKLSQIPDPESPWPERVMIGGTVVDMEGMKFAYGGLAKSDRFARVRALKRLMPLLDRGFGRCEDTLEDLRQRIDDFTRNETDGRVPPVLVGHSQGALYATRLVQEGYGSAAVSLSGPHKGMSWIAHNLVLRAADKIRHNAMPPITKELQCGSQFLDKHIRIIEEEWPEHVPLDNVGATLDVLVPGTAQFGVKLPEHVDPANEWIDMPRGLGWAALRHLLKLHDGVRPLHTDTPPSDHLTILRSRGVRRLIATRQAEVAMQFEQANSTPVSVKRTP